MNMLHLALFPAAKGVWIHVRVCLCVQIEQEECVVWDARLEASSAPMIICGLVNIRLGHKESFWAAPSGFGPPVPSQIRPLPSLSSREIFWPYSTQFTLAHVYRPDFYMHSSQMPPSPPPPPIARKKSMSNKSIKLAAYLYLPSKSIN